MVSGPQILDNKVATASGSERVKDGGSSPIPANRTIAAGGAFLRLVCVLQFVRFGTRTRDQEVVETAPALSLNVQEA